jgi:hypothetical protein
MKKFAFVLALVALTAAPAWAQKKKKNEPKGLHHMVVQVMNIPMEGADMEMVRRRAMESRDEMTLMLLDQSRGGLMGQVDMTDVTDPADLALASNLKAYKSLAQFLNAASELDWELEDFSATQVGGLTQYHLIFQKEKSEGKK